MPCIMRYVSETRRNAEVRLNELNNLTQSSKPSKHPQNNIGHCYTWAFIPNSPSNVKTRKNLEASYIVF